MDNILEIIIWFALGWVIGWWYHSRVLLKNILNNPDHLISLLQAYKTNKDPEHTEDGKEVVECVVEKENGQYFLYSKDDNSFLTQAPTLESALTSLNEKFPNKFFTGLVPADKAKEWGLSKQD
jgi:hypothetical protein